MLEKKDRICLRLWHITHQIVVKFPLLTKTHSKSMLTSFWVTRLASQPFVFSPQLTRRNTCQKHQDDDQSSVFAEVERNSPYVKCQNLHIRWVVLKCAFKWGHALLGEDGVWGPKNSGNSDRTHLLWQQEICSFGIYRLWLHYTQWTFEHQHIDAVSLGGKSCDRLASSNYK